MTRQVIVTRGSLRYFSTSATFNRSTNSRSNQRGHASDIRMHPVGDIQQNRHHNAQQAETTQRIERNPTHRVRRGTENSGKLVFKFLCAH